MNGMSVPERMRTYLLAKADVLVNRGSTEMMTAWLVSFAVRMCCMEMGWFSAGFIPMIRTLRLLRMSFWLLVIAPYPNTLARPATVVECHIRAWKSALFVPHMPAHLRTAYPFSLDWWAE